LRHRRAQEVLRSEPGAHAVRAVKAARPRALRGSRSRAEGLRGDPALRGEARILQGVEGPGAVRIQGLLRPILRDDERLRIEVNLVVRVLLAVVGLAAFLLFWQGVVTWATPRHGPPTPHSCSAHP